MMLVPDVSEGKAGGLRDVQSVSNPENSTQFEANTKFRKSDVVQV